MTTSVNEPVLAAAPMLPPSRNCDTYQSRARPLRVTSFTVAKKVCPLAVARPRLLEREDRPQHDAHGRLRDAAVLLEHRLALVRREEPQRRAEVGQVESGRSRSSRKRNTSDSTAVWVSFRSSTLASSTGPNDSTVARTGAPASPVSESGSTGCERGSTVQPRDAARSATFGSAASIGCASPERSPLTSATKTGTPASERCPAITCSVLGLPRAGGAGDEPVPVHGRERQPDPNAGEHLAVEHRDPRTTLDASSG